MSEELFICTGAGTCQALECRHKEPHEHEGCCDVLCPVERDGKGVVGAHCERV